VSVIDQLALDLPGVAAPPPRVLEGLDGTEYAAVVGVLARLIVKTLALELIAEVGEGDDE
jgi:hypothetical protein